MKPDQASKDDDLRRRAEERLQDRGSSADGPPSTVEMQRLLQELQIHQIELEMQNEELRQASAQQEALHARLVDLYDFAPVGYLTVSTEGIILEANLAVTSMLRTPRGLLIGQPFAASILPDDLDIYHRHHTQLGLSEGPHTCELRLVSNTRPPFWARLESIARQDDGNGVAFRIVLIDLTDRKDMEQALQYCEARFQKLFQEIESVAIQGYRPDGTTIFWNPASEKLYGYGALEALGRNLVDLIIPPEMKTEVARAIASMATTSQPVPAAELSLRRKDGSLVDVFSCHAVLNHPDSGKELFCIDIDLTPLRRVESALRESEERHRLLFESALDALVLFDLETGSVLQANPKAVELYGYDREELGTKTNADLLDKPEQLAECVEDLLASPDQVAHVPLRYHRRKDGSVFPVECTAQLLPMHGKMAIFAVIRDLTPRMRIEEELQQAERDRRRMQEAINQHLREQAEYLTSMYQALDSIGLVVCDLQGNDARIRAFNPGAERLFNLRRQEAVGQSVALLCPEEYKKNIAKGVRLLSLGKPLHSTNIPLTRQSSGCFPAIITIHPFDLHEGRWRKAVGVVRDISELMRVQEQLHQANSVLESRVEQRTRELQETQKKYLHAEKLSAIGKLSASIAHEFNNPLQGIMSIMKGLRRRAQLDPEDRELLEIAIEESERMKNLIRSLSDFNRPSSGKKEFMDVHSSLDSLLLLHKKELQCKRIGLQLDLCKNLPSIEAVPDQIKQVFLNLITNATEACGQAQGGTLTIRTWQEDDRVAIAFSDTGVGIKPNEMDLIFQPFFTTKGAVKGTGLGLSISHGIVKNHKGEIRVDSKPGKGSTFTVFLPLQS